MGIRGSPLRFDFYLPEYNTVIEYDGEQHFKPVERFGGEKAFKTVQLHDNTKTKYCEDNDIRLLRISYKDKNNIQEILNERFK